MLKKILKQKKKNFLQKNLLFKKIFDAKEKFWTKNYEKKIIKQKNFCISKIKKKQKHFNIRQKYMKPIVQEQHCKIYTP